MYGDPSKNNTVAIVSPTPRVLRELAAKLGKTETSTEALCQDEDIRKAVQRELVATATKGEAEAAL